MNIEEAVEWLEIIKEGYEYGDIDSAVTIKGYKRCVEAIETVLNELDKKDKIIDMMAEYIEECTGSCPNDMYDWQEIDCDKECEISMKKCWIEYFYNKVEIPEEN
ncbi:MAG: hypothetical protein UIM53_00955 [Acutalibacteraceae bacterium]|nr:hypothetical protein [Acutalibacteraceae bacterium]